MMQATLIRSTQQDDILRADIARAAVGCLYAELALYPKPGLVSLVDKKVLEARDLVSRGRRPYEPADRPTSGAQQSANLRTEHPGGSGDQNHMSLPAGVRAG